jgi:hypothetical protein
MNITVGHAPVTGATLTTTSHRVIHTALPLSNHSRTALPVLSNRAFVAAWNARRPQLVAAAKVAQKN